jgi:hypothetical protein
MIHPPSNSPSLFKRVMRRLGLDPEQRPYFFYIPNTKSEKGSLIALAATFMVVVAILIPVAMQLVSNTRRNTLQAQEYVAGAQNAAKAGLEDALGYFVRQNKIVRAYSSQVTEGVTPTWGYATTIGSTPTYTFYSYVDQPFNPIYNTTNASYSDTFQAVTTNSLGSPYPITIKPFYGICNEYPLDASTNTLVAAGQTTSVYFGRYEVAEQPSGALTPQAVHDITGTRTSTYLNGDGLVWAINSVGYIYKRSDYTVDGYGEYLVPYNVYPNKVLATAKAYTEFKKLSCTPPNQPSSGVSFAAVYCHAATCVNLSGKCQLGGSMANGYGLCAMSGSATAPIGAGVTNFFGNGVTYTSYGDAPISDVNIFGMSLKDIQFIADYVGSASVPMTIQESYKLSYYNGNLDYSATQTSPIYQQLNTTGILCVNGNLTLETPSSSSTIAPSYFSGIIFCTGNMTINAGCIVDGMVIMGWSAAASQPQSTPLLTLVGSSSDYAYCTADPTAVKNVIQYVAQYREDISARKVLLAFPGI